MKNILLIIILGIILVINMVFTTESYKYPVNNYVFSAQRDNLLEQENLYGRKGNSLTKDEQVVDDYLKYLKWKEFESTKLKYGPARQMKDVLTSIRKSKVYKVLKSFPKGGNMHTHELHQVSRKKLLEIVYSETTDFQNFLYIREGVNAMPLQLDYFVTPPNTPKNPWKKVTSSKYGTKTSFLNLASKFTLMGTLSSTAWSNPSDSILRWKQMNQLWASTSKLVNNVKIFKKYIIEMLKTSVHENVQYIESRKSLGYWNHLYTIDNTYGRRPYTYPNITSNNDTIKSEIKIIDEAIQEIRKTNPNFIGLRRIMTAMRSDSSQYVKNAMERAMELHKLYPNDVVAFDLVGHEDNGTSHLFHLKDFLSLYDDKSKTLKIDITLHTGETNWPQDILYNAEKLQDPVPVQQNTYEAILYGAKRVGHGLAYVKHPYIVNLLKIRNISVEVCPVSNQLLGYVPDLRNHPAINFIRSGVRVMLGSDDAGTLGYDDFTVDWYEAYMGWGLDLIDLKTLATNSLQFSSMTSDESTKAIKEKWDPAYQKWIKDLKQEACNDVTKQELLKTTPTFSSILPNAGAWKGGTKVHIFGRHFERGLCTNITCKFDNVAVNQAKYVNQNHIWCVAPSIGLEKGGSKTVSLQVSFNQAVLYHELPGLKFTYKYDLYEAVPLTSSSAKVRSDSFIYVAVFAALLYYIGL